MSNIFPFINFLFSVMRTGGDPSAPDDLLLNPPEAVHPNYVVTSIPPASQQATSPVTPAIPMELIPANVMSPDEMLRAYAERKKSLAAKPLTSSPPLPATGPINYPKAVVKKRSVKASLKEAGSNTMRVLFNATTKNLSPTNNTSYDDAYGGMTLGRADDQTLSPIEPYDENVAGMGTANAHPFGYHPNAYTEGSYAIEEEEEDGGLAGAGAGAVYYAHAC
jgi:hypothetical protein